jgi:hypothetical protein
MGRVTDFSRSWLVTVEETFSSSDHSWAYRFLRDMLTLFPPCGIRGAVRFTESLPALTVPVCSDGLMTPTVVPPTETRSLRIAANLIRADHGSSGRDYLETLWEGLLGQFQLLSRDVHATNVGLPWSAYARRRYDGGIAYLGSGDLPGNAQRDLRGLFRVSGAGPRIVCFCPPGFERFRRVVPLDLKAERLATQVANRWNCERASSFRETPRDGDLLVAMGDNRPFWSRLFRPRRWDDFPGGGQHPFLFSPETNWSTIDETSDLD